MKSTHDLILALANDPLDGSGVIRLNHGLGAEALSGSVVATRAMMMLSYARDNDGIGLTKGGALNRKFLAWAVEAFDWPNHEPAEVYSINKVVDEANYVPGWYLHEVMKRRKFMRKHRDRLLISPAGRKALDRPGLLQAEFFPETFKGHPLPSIDLPFVGDVRLYFGLLLWQVRGLTEGWATAREIFRVSVIPDDAIHELAREGPNRPIHFFHLRVLRVLSWFGLLEAERDNVFLFNPDRTSYRSTALFDRFVQFHLPTEGGNA